MTTPIYRIEVDGTDVTSNFSDRALSISVTLRDGDESDDCSITVDDRDYAVAIPARGASLKVWLGYLETGLVYLGEYEVDGTSLKGPPRTLSVKGRAAGMRSVLKEHRTEKYEDQTISQIVEKIAGRHGLSVKITGAIGSIKVPRLDQVLRSDLHILTRLSKDYNSIFKIADKQLIFSERGTSPAPDLVLVETDLIDYGFELEDRPRHKEVKARWYDKDQGDEVTETESGGPGDAVFWLRGLFPSQERAQEAAKSHMKALRRYEGTMNVTITGRPEYDPGGRVSVELREGTNGPFLVSEVGHTFDGGGIQTTISGKTENGAD